jgi:hypothetical protein
MDSTAPSRQQNVIKLQKNLHRISLVFKIVVMKIEREQQKNLEKIMLMK